jgi:hypothetical protein
VVAKPLVPSNSTAARQSFGGVIFAVGCRSSSTRTLFSFMEKYWLVANCHSSFG